MSSCQWGHFHEAREGAGDHICPAVCKLINRDQIYLRGPGGISHSRRNSSKEPTVLNLSEKIRSFHSPAECGRELQQVNLSRWFLPREQDNSLTDDETCRPLSVLIGCGRTDPGSPCHSVKTFLTCENIEKILR